ncbi:hypothetical protein SAMN03159496_05193 [Rhizobium sp. NFR07]|nr:hypothetical protein SAMN03159496_05193 [Rhizobium sp. NFR07]
MRDWCQRWAAVLGISLMGPVLLVLFVGCLIQGELPSPRGKIIYANVAPFLFYPLVLLLICGSAGLTYLSIMFVIGYSRGRSKR